MLRRHNCTQGQNSKQPAGSKPTPKFTLTAWMSEASIDIIKREIKKIIKRNKERQKETESRAGTHTLPLAAIKQMINRRRKPVMLIKAAQWLSGEIYWTIHWGVRFLFVLDIPSSSLSPFLCNPRPRKCSVKSQDGEILAAGTQINAKKKKAKAKRGDVCDCF